MHVYVSAVASVQTHHYTFASIYVPMYVSEWRYFMVKCGTPTIEIVIEIATLGPCFGERYENN